MGELSAELTERVVRDDVGIVVCGVGADMNDDYDLYFKGFEKELEEIDKKYLE